MEDLKHKYWPLLIDYTNKYGLRHYGLSSEVKANFVGSDVLLIDLVVRFLEKVSEPYAGWDRENHSYRLKHNAEEYFNIYVPTGVLIAGCIAIGYQFKRCSVDPGDPNAYFKMRIKKQYRKLFDGRQYWDHGEPMGAFLSEDIDQRSFDMYSVALDKLKLEIPQEIANSDPRFNATRLPNYYGCPKNLAWIKDHCTTPTNEYRNIYI